MNFFYIFSSFVAILYAYTGFRLIPGLFNGKKALLAWTALIFLFIVLVVHIYLRTTDIHPFLAQALAWTGYCGLGLISYLFCLAFVRDLFIIPSVAFLKIRQIFSSLHKPIQPNPQRRKFLYKASSTAIMIMGGSIAGMGTFLALQKPIVVQIDIRLKKEFKNLSGLTLVQFTDLHVGPTIGYHYVKKVCDTIKSLKADIIVFTGDLADGSPEKLAHDISPLMELHAPLGKYFITGNHEYYSGADRWIFQAKILGFKPLLNEHRVIEYKNGYLTLAGVTDIRSEAFFPHHRSSPASAIKGAPENSYKLLLAHQPISVYDAAKAGFHLQLSGHTHGGQYFPFEYFIKLQHPFIKGLYRHRQTQVYVNQGTGYWGPPLRMGTFPEITMFRFI